ncbi:hypothetical protein GOV11_02225 [Candidatus Woesearchaeota archaeon]|nr:hypothetical protein [Candidatus Woesearchaeota archaeon]
MLRQRVWGGLEMIASAGITYAGIMCLQDPNVQRLLNDPYYSDIRIVEGGILLYSFAVAGLSAIDGARNIVTGKCPDDILYR